MRIALSTRTWDSLVDRASSNAHLAAFGGDLDKHRLMDALRGRADDETSAMLVDKARRGLLRIDPVTARLLVHHGVDPAAAALIRDVLGAFSMVRIDGEPNDRGEMPGAVQLGDDAAQIELTGGRWLGSTRTLVTGALPDTVVMALPGRPLSDLVALDMPDMVDVTVVSAVARRDATHIRLRVREDGASSATLAGIASLLDPRYAATSATAWRMPDVIEEMDA